MFLVYNKVLYSSISSSLTKKSLIIPKRDDSAYHNAFLTTLGGIKRDIVDSSTLIIGFKGKVIAIDTSTHTTPQTGYTYRFSIEIQSQNKSAGTKRQFNYSDDVLKRTRIVLKDKKTGKETVGRLSDIKTGDEVVIQETVDMLVSCSKDECTSGVTITKEL